MSEYRGFSWHVPAAFREAVALCAFQEGDILYECHEMIPDNRQARLLQVLTPARLPNHQGSTASAVFRRNWGTDCEVMLYGRGRMGKPTHIRTTQGRLYTALWTGDVAWLSASSQPEVPAGVAELKTQLRRTAEIGSRLRRIGSWSSPAFVMPADVSNDLYREKKHSVEASVSPELKAAGWFVEGKTLIPDSKRPIAPTSGAYVFEAPALSQIDLFERIKAALYKPSPNAKKPRFQIARHGYILS